MARFLLFSRLGLGAIFLIVGLNGFLHFLPSPQFPPKAAYFYGALSKTGYFLILLKATEIISGLMLLSGAFVPLALMILAPIVINILMFDLFLHPGGIWSGGFIAGIWFMLVVTYRHHFAGMLVK